MAQAGVFTARPIVVGDAVHIVLAGELDLSGAALLERALRQAAGRAHGSVVIDVAGLTFCDVIGHRAVADAVEAGARLIGEPPRSLQQLFELAAGLVRR